MSVPPSLLSPPYTVARIAERFGMLDGVTDTKLKDKILQLAGKLARTKHQLAALPVKVKEDIYNVYQYPSEAIDTLRQAIQEALTTESNRTTAPFKTIRNFWS